MARTIKQYQSDLRTLRAIMNRDIKIKAAQAEHIADLQANLVLHAHSLQTMERLTRFIDEGYKKDKDCPF